MKQIDYISPCADACPSTMAIIPIALIISYLVDVWYNSDVMAFGTKKSNKDDNNKIRFQMTNIRDAAKVYLKELM